MILLFVPGADFPYDTYRKVRHEVLLVTRTVGRNAIEHVLVDPVDPVAGLHINCPAGFPSQHGLTSKTDTQRIEMFLGKMMVALLRKHIRIELLEVDTRTERYRPTAFPTRYGTDQVVHIDVRM